jgi:hypothetical protein
MGPELVANEATDDAYSFRVRYTDSNRQGRLLFVGVLGSLGCVAGLTGLQFASHSPGADAGWIIPVLTVLLPAFLMIYLLVRHGFLPGELRLNRYGLEFEPVNSAHVPEGQIICLWDQLPGWKISGEEVRPALELQLGDDRKAMTFQLATFDAIESRRFLEAWNRFAGEKPSVDSEPTAGSYFKRAAGWSILLAFLVVSLVLILSGEMDQGAFVRLAYLTIIIVPLAIRMIRRRVTG